MREQTRLNKLGDQLPPLAPGPGEERGERKQERERVPEELLVFETHVLKHQYPSAKHQGITNNKTPFGRLVIGYSLVLGYW